MEQENALILKQYCVMVDMLGLFFKDSVEVVLHSLVDMERSVIYIHNGQKTARKLGSPVTDKALRILEEFQRTKRTLFGPYKTVSREGHVMKSVTTVITNSAEQAIGLLCINFDLATPVNELFAILCADFEGARTSATTVASAATVAANTAGTVETEGAVGTLTSPQGGQLKDLTVNANTKPAVALNVPVSSDSLADVGEHFATDIHDLLNTAVNQTRNQVMRDDSIPQRQKNKVIIQELNKQGLFNLRNAVPIISEILQLSKDAIYLHLRSCKK